MGSGLVRFAAALPLLAFTMLVQPGPVLGQHTDLRASVALAIPWGDGPSELAFATPDEANAEGPMSFAVDAAGDVWILDQLHLRIVVLSQRGLAPRSIPISGNTYQDIAITAEGRIALLDRLATGTVLLLDHTGAPLADTRVLGRGVPQGGAITELLAQDDGLWLQINQLWTVRILDRDGAPDPDRPALPGTRTRDGSQSIRAALHHGAAVVTSFPTAPGLPSRRLARIAFPTPASRIDGIDSDAAGRIYVTACLAVESAEETTPWAEQVVVLAPDGRELQRVNLPPFESPLEQLRAVRMGADGNLYALILSEAGATLWRVGR